MVPGSINISNVANILPEVVPDSVSARTAAGMVETGSLLSRNEISLSLLIMVFALVTIFVFWLLVRGQPITQPIMRLFVIIVLVFGTLLVVSSAYTTDQIAPVVGFFGTIAGYLLGKSDKPNDPPST